VFAFGSYGLIKHYQTLIEPHWIAASASTTPFFHAGEPPTTQRSILVHGVGATPRSRLSRHLLPVQARKRKTPTPNAFAAAAALALATGAIQANRSERRFYPQCYHYRGPLSGSA
jgi:hypothetical protein